MLNCPSLVALLVTSSLALAAQSDWERLLQGAVHPVARSEHALAEDLERDRVVLFGGRTASGALLSDTWVWDGQGFVARSPTRVPPARRLAAMAWHPQRQRVLLFGGIDSTGLLLDDLWEWDGVDWTQVGVGPGARPAPRAAAAIAAGTTDGALCLFGGVDAAGQALGDTWRWDGSAWSSPALSVAPPARFGHRLVGDLARRRLVLFGDRDGRSDTWEWDGAGWQLVMNPSPPGSRSRHGMCYDAARGRVVLHGGTDQLAYALDDTWEWNGGSWLLRSPPTVPAAVVDTALAFDPIRERTLRFGGFHGITAHDAIWSYGAVQPARVLTFGAGCTGTAGVPRLAVDVHARPWLGDTFDQHVDRVPLTAPIALHVGFSRTTWGGQTLPLALDFVGMPACRLHASIDAIGILLASGGRASLALTVPQSPVLVGASFYSQALVIDFSANAAGVTATNALEFVIGSR